MMSRYLSGEELAEQCKRLNELPGRGGFKDHEPDGSWLQRMKLENFHDERLEKLKEERVERLGALSTGVWDPERGKVAVIKNRGKFWKNHGHCVEGEKLLFPEEALFLVDQGVMEVVEEGRPMSLQELYYKLLPNSRSFDDYVVCSHLMRLGFIVKRAENVVKELHGNSPQKKRPRDDDIKNIDNKISSVKRLKSVADISDPTDIQEHVKGERSPQHQSQELLAINDTPIFFDIFQTKSDKIVVDPSTLTEALPGLCLTRTMEFDVAMERRILSIIAKDQFENPDEKNGRINNWNQWNKLSRRDKVLQTRARVLWEDDDLHPLHDPDILCSPAETMKRLRGSQKESTPDYSKILENLPKRESDEQMFHVFPPDSKFKKSNPGRPMANVVCIGAQSTPPLNMGSLKMISDANNNGSSFMFGVVEGGRCLFLV